MICHFFAKGDGNFTLETANRVYAYKEFSFNPKYLQILKNYFGVEPEQINFAKSVEAAAEINGWVENKTRHRIKDLFNSGL